MRCGTGDGDPGQAPSWLTLSACSLSSPTHSNTTHNSRHETLAITMASYSTMNTIPAADVDAETPVLSRDIKVNAKALLGGAAVTAFVLGMLAATTVTTHAPRAPAAFYDPQCGPQSASTGFHWCETYFACIPSTPTTFVSPAPTTTNTRCTRNRAAASTSIGRSKRIDRSEKQQKIWKASPSS